MELHSEEQKSPKSTGRQLELLTLEKSRFSPFQAKFGISIFIFVFGQNIKSVLKLSNIPVVLGLLRTEYYCTLVKYAREFIF